MGVRLGDRPPAALADLRPVVMVIMYPIYRDEISRDLAARKVRAEVLAL